VALFLGTYEYLIDDKGRVNIPARFREQLAKENDNTLAVFKGMDGCIAAYPLSTLEKFRARFEGHQFVSEEDARLLERFMADGGTTPRPDSQGRIILSSKQREHAGLVREVAVFGAWNRIEIWEPARLEAHLAEAKKKGMESLANKFLASAGGIGKE